ncbi:MAG: type III-A CRISPR-associated protein Csm2 [Bryobacterales bacterium]|nr:type III-A CRISPR-associated protein Csm2 [Bryobacterales bacterium]
MQPQKVVYFGSDGQIRPELLDGEAREVARALAGKVNKTQLRRYYHDVMNLQRRLSLMAEQLRGSDRRQQAFARLRADFMMLKAKAHYANGRSRTTFPDELLQFFVNHTHAVKTVDDFDAFCRHFQAVVAFHEYFGKEEKR